MYKTFILILTLQLFIIQLYAHELEHNVTPYPEFKIKDHNYLYDFNTFDQNGVVQVVIEIPTGTINK